MACSNSRVGIVKHCNVFIFIHLLSYRNKGIIRSLPVSMFVFFHFALLDSCLLEKRFVFNVLEMFITKHILPVIKELTFSLAFFFFFFFNKSKEELTLKFQTN